MFHLKKKKKSVINLEAAALESVNVLFLELLFKNQYDNPHWRLLRGEVSSKTTRYVTEQV